MKAKLLILSLCLLLTVPALAYDSYGNPGCKTMFHSANGGWLNIGEDYAGIYLASKNTASLGMKFFGISAEYGALRGFDTKSPTGSLQRFGIGLGLPDAEFFRLFGTYYILKDYKDFKLYDLEMAKSFTSENFRAQFGLQYTASDNNALALDPAQEFFMDEIEREFNRLEVAPNQEYRANLSLSTVNNKYLQAVSCNGLCPSSHPLLLCGQAGMRLDAVFSHSKGSGAYSGQSRTATYIGMPVNAGRWFGLDFRYLFTFYEDSSPPGSHSNVEHHASIGLRPVLFIAEPTQLTLIADGIGIFGKDKFNGISHAGFGEAYRLRLGGIFCINVSERALLYAKLISFNDWDLKGDVTNLTNFYNMTSFGVNIRF